MSSSHRRGNPAGLSTDDRARIAEYLNTPAYRRDPEMLVPGDESNDE